MLNYNINTFKFIEDKIIDNTDIVSKLLKLTLTKKEINIKYHYSVMRDVLTNIIQNRSKYKDKDVIVFIAQHKNTIYGWGLLYNLSLKKHKVLHIYVAKRYRKNKIGTNILHHAAQICSNNKCVLQVSPWDEVSHCFFAPYIKCKGVHLSTIKFDTF